MRLVKIVAIVLCVMFFSSCGTFVYKSVSAKTPLLTKRNDFVGQLSLGGAGGEVYMAYSPIKYLGVSFSYAGHKRTSDSVNIKDTGKFRDYEMSLIPYYSFEQFIFEAPTGLGLTQRKELNIPFKSYSPYSRLFVQPTIGIRKDGIEFALFMRVSQIDYLRKQWGIDTRYEPGFTFKAGSKNIKGMLQMRLDYGTNYSKSQEANLHIEDQVLYFPIHISIGVSSYFNFSKKSKTPNVVNP